MSVDLSPYVVFRRARLPLSELSGLDFDATWRAIEEERRAAHRLRELGSRVTDHLAERVPEVTGAARRSLIAVRRDVHNARAERVAALRESRRDALGPALDATIAEWLGAVERLDRAHAAAAAALDTDTRHARAGFPRILRHDAMAASLQLSGEQLHRSIRAYVENDLGPTKPARIRTIETSWINFVYRAAMKPSPFGRFTEIGAFDPADPPAPPAAAPDDARSSVVLNRVLLNWLVGAMQRLEGGFELGHLLLNSTLRREPEVASFVGTVTHAEAYSDSESVVRLKLDPTLRLVLDSLEQGSAPAAAVLATLAEHTGDAQAARRILDALQRIGLVAFRPGIDEHNPDYTAALLGLLAEGRTAPLRDLHRHLDVLHRVELAFPTAPLEQRPALLAAATRAIEDTAATCGVAVPPDSSMRAPLFEDVWTSTGPAAWDASAVAAALPGLDALWRLSAVLDYGQVQRVALYSFALRHFDGRDSVPFLDFFAAFAALSEAERDALLAGHGCDLALTLATQRDRALRDIDSATTRHDGVATVEPDAIAAACATVQDCRTPESITFRLQFARSGLATLPVVNGVFTGFGAYFSRFAQFVEPEGWNLRRAVRDHVRAVRPGQTDLNAVFGFNFNLHPVLTERMLDYPGSWPTAAADRTLLAQTDIVLDHAKHELRLLDRNRGTLVDLLPMNFLISVGMPPLYQLLDALSPTTRYPWQPASHLRDGLDPHTYPGSTPRLMVGDVVADRQAWTVTAASIPDLAEVGKGSLTALAALDEWRIANGLPRDAFVLCQTLDEHNALTGRTGGIPLKWAQFEHLHRASVHKPMYVDFRNPFLVRSFAKIARSRPDMYVSFRECLPAVDDYTAPRGARSPEEYFVELDRTAS